jgi:hypothetical protein
MNGYTSREIILLIILGCFMSITMEYVEYKYSLGTFILFSIIFVILIQIARLIYYKGNLPPKNPYRRRKLRPFTRDPLAIFL